MVSKLLKAADLTEECVQVFGDGLDRNFTIRFRGESGTAARRVDKVLQARRGEGRRDGRKETRYIISTYSPSLSIFSS